MSGKELMYIAYLCIQLVLCIGLIYFSFKALLVMYTISPLYKGAVPYVPTRRKSISEALKLLDVKEGEKVIDLGCGNGQFLLRGARKINAQFVGVELNFLLFMISKMNSFFARKKGSIILRHGSYYSEDLSCYDKIFLFHMPSAIIKLIPKLEKEVKSGARILSVMFPIESEEFLLKRTTGEKYKLYLYERRH
jgi:SAM-dependent methyltransferase